jgi:hypothetical protein
VTNLDLGKVIIKMLPVCLDDSEEMVRVPLKDDLGLSLEEIPRNHSYSTQDMRDCKNFYSPLRIKNTSENSVHNLKPIRKIVELEDTSGQECSFHTAEQRSQFLSEESASDLVQILKSDEQKLVKNLFESVERGDVENLKLTL